MFTTLKNSCWRGQIRCVYESHSVSQLSPLFLRVVTHSRNRKKGISPYRPIGAAPCDRRLGLIRRQTKCWSGRVVQSHSLRDRHKRGLDERSRLAGVDPCLRDWLRDRLNGRGQFEVVYDSIDRHNWDWLMNGCGPSCRRWMACNQPQQETLKISIWWPTGQRWWFWSSSK